MPAKKVYTNSPLDFVSDATKKRFQYDVVIRMNYRPHSGRKSAQWRKIKSHLEVVVKRLCVATESDLKEIIDAAQIGLVPIVFEDIAQTFLDALQRGNAVSAITLGNGEKIELWEYEDNEKFVFVPAFVLKEQRTMAKFPQFLPQVSIPEALRNKMSDA